MTQWQKDKKSDRQLQDCCEIIQQLNSNQQTDVAKDLQYVLDMKSKYKTE